ncbi:MAG: single-stranded DNA-binding protein [Clostridium sp.]|nr:single-stranded DNA-binding protein [Clostridium sp.]
MLNQVVIVGRLVEKPIIEENENGKKVCNITLAVPRSYKNVEGIYDTDFIKCTLLNGIAENTAEYCNKGDLIAVKGRLQCLGGNELQVVAEKVTFLSSNKTNNDKEEE